MADLKNKTHMLKKSYVQAACVFVLILLAVFLIWFNNSNSTQAQSAMMAQVYFDGEYRIADGPWQEIVDGEHIPSTKGDVTLRGNFHMTTPYGEYVGIYTGDVPVAFYTNHINVIIYELLFKNFLREFEGNFLQKVSLNILSIHLSYSAL